MDQTPCEDSAASPPGALEDARFEIFLACAPGLEAVVMEEAKALGFRGPRRSEGGVAVLGGWPEVWRANLHARCVTRVLARLARFPVSHLAQLDKRARRLPWNRLAPGGASIRVEAMTRASRLYHSGAVSQRIADAAAAVGEFVPATEATLRVMARIDRNVCTLSVDTSGELLHKRGYKQAVAKAPLRETLAAAFLRLAGFVGEETVLDPMCGSGTIVLEAASWASRGAPGATRAFAFEHLTSFEPEAWEAMKAEARAAERAVGLVGFGFDRDPGAVSMSRANAERAGLTGFTQFDAVAVADLRPPDAPPGLVMVNPPYGGRIGDRGRLRGLYAALGRTLREGFAGWRVGVVTSEAQLAKATGLPFLKPGPAVAHGGLRVRLHLTGPLA